MKRPFRVLLLMYGGVEWAGGTEYSRNLVRALNDLPEVRSGQVELDLLASRDSPAWALRELAQHVRHTYYVEDELGSIDAIQRIRGRLGRRRNVHVPDSRYDRLFARHGIDFAYPHFGGRSSRVRSVPWIPDFQHKVLPQYFGAHEIADRDRLFSAVAREAPLVVLSSETAQGHFSEHYPDASAESRVLPFRAAPDDAWYETDADEVRRKYHLPERFFVVCNQFWEHKNHFVVFDALHRLGERGVRPAVVCTGLMHDPRNPQYSSEVLQRIQSLGLSSQVTLLGLVPKPEQIQLMRHGLAVIQPSLFEGWSTVVEEARCLAKALLLSAIPVHREQAPPDASYFDPASADDLADLLDARWHSTKPGLDLAAEAAARSAQREHLAAIGRKFMAIALEAP